MKTASLLAGLVFAAWTAVASADEPCPVWAATRVQVGAQSYRVEVAATDATRERGLSGRPSLPADAGMWFALPAPGMHGFWMKDMGFPIDLVWIGPDQRVLGSLRLAPCGPNTCPIYYPPAPAAYVLEVNAGGFAGKLGDQADWLCPP